MIAYRRFVFAGLTIAFLAAFARADEPAPAPAPISVRQLARSAHHDFVTQLTPYDDLHAANGIQVFDRNSGVLVQTIDGINGLEISLAPERFLKVDDANADGHPDISVLVNNGGSGPNSARYFYLFDPASGQFRFHEGLSELSQPMVHRNGTVTSAGRSGGQHTASTYRFIRGKMVEIKRVDQTWSSDGKFAIVTTGTLRGGKMRFTSRRRLAVPG